jgi:hypothetical protein
MSYAKSIFHQAGLLGNLHRAIRISIAPAARSPGAQASQSGLPGGLLTSIVSRRYRPDALDVYWQTAEVLTFVGTWIVAQQLCTMPVERLAEVTVQIICVSRFAIRRGLLKTYTMNSHHTRNA